MVDTFREYLVVLILDRCVQRVETITDELVGELLNVFHTSLQRAKKVLGTPTATYQQKLLILSAVRRHLSEAERSLLGGLQDRRSLTEAQIRELVQLLTGCREAIQIINLDMNALRGSRGL